MLFAQRFRLGYHCLHKTNQGITYQNDCNDCLKLNQVIHCRQWALHFCQARHSLFHSDCTDDKGEGKCRITGVEFHFQVFNKAYKSH